MQQIKTVWAALDNRKRMVVFAAAATMFVSIIVMSKMAASPTLKLLYAGLESGAAGDVIGALDQRGIAYEVRGGSIYVPAGLRDELRMTLASEGLPANGGRGYELLDSLSGFGTTSQMFDAAYWRAKEGELARTIVASPYVGQARVHIAKNGSNPFQRGIEPTASVSLVPSGAPITPAQANAVRYLVASAIAGLAVENVAVIDANGTVIGSAETTASPSTADDRARLLRERVLRLVEARVGAGNAVVEISVDTVTETESIRERRFDPESRVAISTDTEERSDSSENQAGGEVTVASNLPDGDAAAAGGSRTQISETRERINYEVSETELEILRAPGAVKRLTVAVLLNGLREEDTNGEAVFRERPAEELAALRDLVASAVGFDAERGDVITLKSMELPAVQPLGTVAETSFLQKLEFDPMALVQIGALAFVSLVLGLFVIRPILAKPPAPPAPAIASLPPKAAPQTPEAPALTGEIEIDQTGRFEAVSDLSGEAAARHSSASSTVENREINPVERLRSMIGERQEETVEILRNWLEDAEESA